MQIAILIVRWVLAIVAIVTCVRLFGANARRVREGKDSHFCFTPTYFLAVIAGVVGIILIPFGQWEDRGIIALLLVLPPTALFIWLVSWPWRRTH